MEHVLKLSPGRKCGCPISRPFLARCGKLNYCCTRTVELTTGLADPRRDETEPGHPLFPPHQLCPGAPRTSVRGLTKRGRSPSKFFFSLFRHHQSSGAPHLARFFARCGIPLLCPEALSPQLLLIPPVARNAKNRAPERWLSWMGCFFSGLYMRFILRLSRRLQRTSQLPLGTPRSHQLTWDEKDGPSPTMVFFPEPNSIPVNITPPHAAGDQAEPTLAGARTRRWI